MTDLTDLCPVCFAHREGASVCPVCRSEEQIKQNAPLLPLRSSINGRYYIGKAHKKNSEGITYGAYDLKINRPCSVREFFPDALVSRDADGFTVIPGRGSEEDFNFHKTSFAALWNKLLRLKGLTALVSVYDVFSANGTVYAVYEESERYNLRSYLLDTPEGCLSWDKARILMMPVLSTLGTLHTSGVIHRGINPEAFIFSSDGKLKLTDFSIEQARTAAGDLNAQLFDGYSALEQYATTGETGSWTDIYAFSAVLYRVLIGTTPIDAKTRAQNDRMMIPAKFAEQLPPYVINAIINGMQLAPADRTRTVEQLRSNLSASPKAVNASARVYPDSARQATRPVTNPALAKAAAQQANRAPANRPAPASAPRRPSSPTERVDSGELEHAKANGKKGDGKTALIVVLVIIVVALLVTIGVMGVKWFGGNPSDNTETTTGANVEVVPNFLGYNAGDIMSNGAYTSRFSFQKVEQPNSTVPAGIIIGQTVAADTQVPTGTLIVLTVSSGKKTVVLEDYANCTFTQVEAMLADYGITCKRALRQNDGSHPADVVIQTYPGAGTTVAEGDEITVLVWQDLEAENDTGEEIYTGGDGPNSVQEFLENLEGTTVPRQDFYYGGY